MWERMTVRLLMVIAPFETTVRPLVKLEIKVLMPLKVTPAVAPEKLLFRLAPSPAVLLLAVMLAMEIKPLLSMYNALLPPLELNLFVPVNVTPAGVVAVLLERYAPCSPLLSAVTLLRVITPAETQRFYRLTK